MLSTSGARRYLREMENPYQSPQSIGAEAVASAGGGLARHVAVVAILLMVQGGLEILMGGFYVFLGVMTAVYAQQEGVRPGLAIGGVYGVMGAASLGSGILHAVAGWRNYFFRTRWLGIVALVAGLGALFTCYCFPTSVALMIYGLIVYLNAQSARAFEWGQQGMSREQIVLALTEEY